MWNESPDLVNGRSISYHNIACKEYKEMRTVNEELLAALYWGNEAKLNDSLKILVANLHKHTLRGSRFTALPIPPRVAFTQPVQKSKCCIMS